MLGWFDVQQGSDALLLCRPERLGGVPWKYGERPRLGADAPRVDAAGLETPQQRRSASEHSG